MAVVIQYALATGVIRWVWVSQDAALLAAQIVEGDPVYGYITTEAELDLETLQERSEVVAAVVVTKVQGALIPDVLTFAADGVAECTITVEPFVECTLTINGGDAATLTLGDPTLVITTDTPERLTIALVPMAGMWAEPVTVEAV